MFSTKINEKAHFRKSMNFNQAVKHFVRYPESRFCALTSRRLPGCSEAIDSCPAAGCSWLLV